MMPLRFLPLLPAFLLSSLAQAEPASEVRLDSLNLSHVQQGYGTAQAGKTVEGTPLILGGKIYPHGVGTHSVGAMLIELHGAATGFQAVVGVDDDTQGKGSVSFVALVDGREVARTPVLHGKNPPVSLKIDLTGAHELLLLIEDGHDGNKYDHADWAEAVFTLAPGATTKPEIVAISDAPPRLKIPAPNPQPEIHGARVTGATPGHPFLFPVPATGAAPLTYAAKDLPEGLQIDARTGVISGQLGKEGTADVTLTVTNALGSATRHLSIVAGPHKLALTPPMGWNSWNVWASHVDEGKVRDAAREMIETGLVAHGYQYVNIDDCWQGTRDAQGVLAPNKKFPDMKALCDDLHAKGLKAGIYSSPGPKTCAGYAGSLDHEAQDAKTYAAWGFDYLKYDLCSYTGMIPKDGGLPAEKAPYIKMATALDGVDRDILYSLCQYGRGHVWEWGAEPDIHANAWRTYSDIDDVWQGSSSWGSDRGVYDIIKQEAGHEKFAGPGHWNDPDMLMVGVVGFGNTHPSHLTKNEQITHVSMWSMFAAPLLIGCDMTKFDDFTLAILTNDEVLAIDQDTLGHAASRVAQSTQGEVWSRPLADGTHAVALLNPLPVERTVTVKWSDIGVEGSQPVRDLWLHEDVGAFDGSYSAKVPAHGTVLVKIGKPRP